MRARLILKDGRVFLGESAIPITERTGRVIFDTRIVGYQQAITDPANAGKILIFTYPLIGNYGTAKRFNESEGVWPVAVIVKESSPIYSHWQAKERLNEWARNFGLPVIYGVDTRSLTVHLRKNGEMLGLVSTASSVYRGRLQQRAEKKHSYLEDISLKEIKQVGSRKGKRIAVLDLGLTQSILRQLKRLKLNIFLLPYKMPAEEILKLKPKTLIISNGPENDCGLKEIVPTVKRLAGKIPILGISAGAQVLALSLGAKIKRMYIGHHGLNYPIKSVNSLKGEITIQNHSYEIEAKSLIKCKDIKITAYNLNDHTVEEFENRRLKLIGVLYYPLSPGFEEVHPIFRRFLKYA